MVPFVDVVLVLLNVPKTHAVKETPEQRVVVSVDKQQLIYLGNTPVNVHELGDKVKAQQRGTEDAVFLRCDETVPFGVFASVVDALRVSGINNISIVTEPITDRPRSK